jgi:hypothetical protein
VTVAPGRVGNWIASGLRDWRVWALVAFLQIPALRPMTKYLPDVLVPAIPLYLIGTLVAYAAMLHAPGVRLACSSLGHRWWYLAAIVLAAALVSGAAYPRVDALKTYGRGSDEDDQLIQTSQRLIAGDRPLYVPTYLGNAPTAGPGWALAVSPLVLSGTYFLLTALALAALPLIIAGTSDRAAIALGILLPISSPAFWELLATGSDIFPIGVVFAALTAAVIHWQTRGLLYRLACLALALIAVSTRFVLVYGVVLIGCFLWKRNKLGGALLAGVTVAFVVLQCLAWLPHPEWTPLHLLTRRTRALGPTWFLLAAACSVLVAVAAIHRTDERAVTWIEGMWAGFATPLVAVSAVDLVNSGFSFSAWRGATYFAAAMPLLVVAIAVRPDASPDQRS